MGILVKKIDLKPGLRIHHTAEPDFRFRTFAEWRLYIDKIIHQPHNSEEFAKLIRAKHK